MQATKWTFLNECLQRDDGGGITMRKYEVTILAAVAVLLTLLLCACNFDESTGNLQGGDLLDANRISEIKEDVLATEETATTETDFESITTEQEESEEKTNDTDSTSQTQTQQNSGSTSDTDNVEIGETVYWTEGGGVWHLYRDCGHLKNSQNVLSGTVEEAENAGKDHVCSTCNKKAGKQ